MYNYLYAVGRFKDYQPGFHVVNISSYPVGDLEKLYSVLYIVATDTLYNTKICLTLDDYRLSFAKTPLMTIQEWLNTKVGDVLKQSPLIPGKDRKFVKLERLFTHGFYHYPADLNLAKDRQNDLISEAAPDIRLTHYKYTGGINYNEQVDKALFNVNGVFYRSVGRSDGVYLLGAGGDYVKLKRDVRASALSFEKLGNLKSIPITKDNLFEYDSNGVKSWKVKLENTDLNNKTIWMVVNGQLITDSEMVYQVGVDTVMVNLSGFDAVRHYQVYREFTRTPKLTNFTKLDQYKKEALTMHNSFIILVNNPTLGIEVVPLTTFNYPNVLHTEERFQHPIVLDNGLFPVPYIKTYGIGQRLLNHDVRISRYYPIQSSGNLAGNPYNSMEINQGDPGVLPRGYLFKISGVTFEAV